VAFVGIGADRAEGVEIVVAVGGGVELEVFGAEVAD
jgi:hypothetical protein